MSYRDKETLRTLYHDEGMSLRDIGDKYGVSNVTIYRWMKRHGIERRDDSRSKGYHGVYHELEGPEGYERVRVRDGGKHRAVRIHRLVAVAEHGFDSVKDMDIHHENHCKIDNRAVNLKPMKHDEHASVHRKT